MRRREIVASIWDGRHENDLSREVIGAAIEVHRQIGPGLVEKIYEEAMCHELHIRGIPFERQTSVPFVYKGVTLSADLKTDIVVARRIVLELKAKEVVHAIDRVQLLTYLRLLDLRLGLLVNFNVPVLRNGVSRVVNDLRPVAPDAVVEDPPDLKG